MADLDDTRLIGDYVYVDTLCGDMITLVEKEVDWLKMWVNQGQVYASDTITGAKFGSIFSWRYYEDWMEIGVVKDLIIQQVLDRLEEVREQQNADLKARTKGYNKQKPKEDY